MQLGRFSMQVDNAPDPGDVGTLPIAQFQAVRIEPRRYRVELLLLFRGEDTQEVLLSQLVPLLQQSMPGFVATEVDLHCGRPAIRADNEVAIHRAREEFLPCQRPVGSRARQRPHFPAQVIKGDPRAFKERHIQQADDGLDVVHGRNFVTQCAQVGQDGFTEKVLVRCISDDQVVIRAVARADRTVVLEGLVILEDQRIGRGVQPECRCVIRKESHYEANHEQRNRGPFQDQLVVGVQQRGHGLSLVSGYRQRRRQDDAPTKD